MASRGRVRSWEILGMEGVIDSDDTPGGSWTPRASVVVHGLPVLTPGEEVEFEWQHQEEPRYGYSFFTVRAWPLGAEPVAQSDRPMSGAWDIAPDGTVTEVTDLDGEEPIRVGTWSVGVVSVWNGEESWGVIDSEDTLGGCWAFFSALHPDEVIDSRSVGGFSIGGGQSNLEVGEQVDFEWEPAIDQDGYRFRAIKVRPRREIPPWRIKRFEG
ncbi:hypothetical protein O4220_19680 [Rhodococcus ruber]|uniref:Uncharacterized protein n=1 Tax=Rhodococcus ruber TaxID=1830 RepID=A0ABT4MIC2_9NOCA|nr:hypothetical protein [Rhodococcus ruber]MCZ4520736.1 hypothetical protein [Rhodococcus ruber]